MELGSAWNISFPITKWMMIWFWWQESEPFQGFNDAIRLKDKLQCLRQTSGKHGITFSNHCNSMTSIKGFHNFQNCPARVWRPLLWSQSFLHGNYVISAGKCTGIRRINGSVILPQWRFLISAEGHTPPYILLVVVPFGTQSSFPSSPRTEYQLN